jgi:hypothetical protein
LDWRDWVNLSRFAITVVGFLVSVVLILKAKTAAESARTAAVEARDGLRRFHMIGDFASAITMMEEVKRLHRVGILQTIAVLPDRYASLRKCLTGAVHAKRTLTDSQRLGLQLAIQQTSVLERLVEQAVADPGKLAGLSVPEMNRTLSEVIDKLHDILAQIEYNS